MNQIIALTISHDNPIHARAIAAVEIHFLPFFALPSSAHDENTKNQEYNIYIKATKANIHKIQLIATCTSLTAYHKVVEYSDLFGNRRIQFNFSFCWDSSYIVSWVPWAISFMSCPSFFGSFTVGLCPSRLSSQNFVFADHALLKLGKKISNQINKYTHIL